MTRTVIGLIDNRDEAQKVIDELLGSGFERKDIGVVSGALLREAQAAIADASRGMTLGGFAGLLVAATTLLVPGIGAVVAAGPGLTLLAGTTIGALAGGLISALRSRGVPEQDAELYAEGVRRGATLLTVNAKNDELAARAREIMKQHGAVDVGQRAAEWKRSGWKGRMQGRPEAQPPAAGTQAPAGTAGAQPAASANAAGPAAEPALALSAVEIYEVVIEPPAEDERAQGARTAANRPRSSGPERRVRDQPYSGADRRTAA
jgi:hypothetical protein